ncbi:hypothetical protein GCM10011390_50380 [Aureimonas endophytica]|uniref:DNA primase/polymerase bifunctional N-terminal domain-containing protein n=1 Tax=Aureimonas endophytica TaxID=2027858 RepID=A0A917A432_9HYPH|nr:bifunctional DNA primase/polymerase [Aureimonas endophytica]GGE24873.1 hypothetical protein GCM10011390_50380 [Aureimonas endophytica]
MGIFSEWQPQYAERGIATFPVYIDGKDKRPAIKRWQNIGRPGSRKLAEKFTDCNAFGINVKANGFTVLDVDTPDERVLADAISEFGDSPIIIQSGSGNHQVWYRNSGEGRSIRPDPNRPIDILGDGYVVGAPSLGAKGRYRMIQGNLDDLKSLPPMRRRTEAPSTSKPKTEIGTRNRDLYEACMRAAGDCGSEEELVSFASAYSDENFSIPLPNAEVLRVAASAWRAEREGRNRFGRGRFVQVPHDIVAKLAASDPDALALFVILHMRNWQREEFFLANAMAADMGWRLPRWRAARDRLAEFGQIECTHRGGRGPKDPPKYRWLRKGYESVHQ